MSAWAAACRLALTQTVVNLFEPLDEGKFHILSSVSCRGRTGLCVRASVRVESLWRVCLPLYSFYQLVFLAANTYRARDVCQVISWVREYQTQLCVAMQGASQ